MGLASHLGPWLLGTVKDTVGTSASLGQIRNMGATIVTQSRSVLFSDQTAQTTLCVIPAGSLITNISYIATTSYNATPTMTFFIGGTQVSSAASITTTGTTNFQANLGTNSAAGAALIANTGTTDAVLAFTQTNAGQSAGAGILVVQYVVRNSDGTYAPTAFTA